MDAHQVTEAEVKAKLDELGLPINPEEIASLVAGVNRVHEMSAANRAVVTDLMAPVLLVRPARRPARRS
jgi:hypothetical protein